MRVCSSAAVYGFASFGRVGGDDRERLLVVSGDLALAVLLEDVAVLGQLVQGLRLEEPVGERGVMRVEHVRADLQADELEQHERVHREPERLLRLDHGLERGALLDRVHRLAEQLGQHAVDHEAGRVLGDDRVLAQLLGRDHRGAERDLVRLGRVDDLDERHHRDRVEEVEADQALGVLQLRADLVDRERRGVGGEDRVVGDVLLDLGEDLLLDAELLEDGLDDPVAVGEVGLVGGAGDERLQPVGLVGVDAPLAEQLVDLAADRRPRPCRRAPGRGR